MFALQHYHAFDIEVKKKRKKKIMTFGAFLGMGILMGVLALGTNFKYHSALSNNYDCLLQDAALEKSEQNIQEKYAQAISIKPGKAETYMLLLQDDIMKDSVLTENEAYTIRDVLSAKSKGNKTNEEYFSKNKEKYEEFSYQLGVAYYFAYEDKENKTLAKKWLDTATKAKTLDEKQKERAKLLLKITDYYLKIGVESKSGDASVGYDEYFKDLMQLKDSYDPAKDDKKEIQIMSGELKYQISKSKDLFIQNGITEEEINEVLAE